jgi:hypothetical protein
LLKLLEAKGSCTRILPALVSLEINDAVLLPGMRETGGQCLKFKLSPRLTSHVRHKAKYLDVRLLVEQGFWFSDHGETVAGPARTLKDFLTLLDVASASVVAGHAHRGDFSRWIADVFHDHALASEIRKLEQRFRLRHIHDLSESIARLVQERYEFTLERSMEAKLAGASRESSSLNVYAAHSGGD